MPCQGRREDNKDEIHRRGRHVLKISTLSRIPFIFTSVLEAPLHKLFLFRTPLIKLNQSYLWLKAR